MEGQAAAVRSWRHMSMLHQLKRAVVDIAVHKTKDTLNVNAAAINLDVRLAKLV